MKRLILVTGSEGLVGSRFVKISKFKKFLFCPKLPEFDITNLQDVKDIISSYNFSVVINFAAFTDVNKAEEERGDKNGSCWQVNVEGVRNLVEVVKPHQERIHYIQISTDMVFSGNASDPGPYSEDDPIEKNVSRLTWYGYTKGRGEGVVREVLGNRASIVRIIYPVRASFDKKLDYIRKPLQLFDLSKLYPLFSDQKITITYIDELCRALDKIITDNIKGTFHICSNDTTTPYELISEVVRITRSKSDKVRPIMLDDFLQKNGLALYRYPRFGGLLVRNTEKLLEFKFSSWKKIVNELISQGLGKPR